MKTAVLACVVVAARGLVLPRGVTTPRAVLPLSVLFDSGGEAKKVGTEQGPVSWFNYHKKPKTCEDVEAKCNEQCNKDNQCTTCCVNCPDNPMEKCFVKPVACTIHSDG